MKTWISKRFASKVDVNRDEARDLSIPPEQITDLSGQIFRIASEFSKSIPKKVNLSITATLSLVTPSHLVLSNLSILIFYDLATQTISDKKYELNVKFMSYCPQDNSILVSADQNLRISLSTLEIEQEIQINPGFCIQYKENLLTILDDQVVEYDNKFLSKPLYQHEGAFMVAFNENYVVSLSEQRLIVFDDIIVFNYDRFSTCTTFVCCNSNFVAVCGEFSCVLVIKFGTWQTLNLFAHSNRDNFNWLGFQKDSDILIAASDHIIFTQDLSTHNEPYILNNTLKKHQIAGFLDDNSPFSCTGSFLHLYPPSTIPDSLDRSTIRIYENIIGLTIFNNIIFIHSTTTIFQINPEDLSITSPIQSDLKNEIFYIYGGRNYLIISQIGGIFLFNQNLALYKKIFISRKAQKIGQVDENLVILTEDSVILIDIDEKVLNEFSYFANPPTCWSSFDRILLIGDSQGEIKAWNMDSGNLVKSMSPSNNKVEALEVNQIHGIFISSDGTSTIKLWKLSTFHCFYEIYTDTCSQFFSMPECIITLSNQKEISFWDLNDFSKITSIHSSHKLKSISNLNSKIISISKSKLSLFSSPFQCKNIQVFGVQPEKIPKFKKYVSKSINSKPSKLPINFSNTLISPYNINLFILSTYLNNRELLLDQINSTSLHPTSSGETGISICMSKNFIELTPILFKNLKEKISINPYSLFYLENSLLELNKRSVPGLHKLYKLCMGRSITRNLPKFCLSTDNMPIVIESSSIFTVPSEFMPMESYSNLGKAINFSHTYIKINNILGSSESIEFIDSLVMCENSEVFKTELIRTILMEKWKKVKNIIMVQALIYCIFIVLLALYITNYKNQQFLVAPFVVSKILMLYETYQLILGPYTYLTDMWNLVDFARASLFLAYSILVWTDGGSYNEMLAIIVFLTWSRGITYFRVFSGTRYYINLLFEVIKSMSSFFIIFFYSIVGFGLVFFVLGDSSTYFDYLTSTYTLNFGNMDTNNYNKLEWLFFLLVTIFNPIIMLNLLISIMSETYDRVKSNFDTADLIELCHLIKEAELLLFWRRSLKTRNYIHVLDLERTSTQSKSEEAYLKDLNRSIKDLTSCIKLGHESVTRGLGNSQVSFANINTSISEIKSKLGIRR